MTIMNFKPSIPFKTMDVYSVYMIHLLYKLNTVKHRIGLGAEPTIVSIDMPRENGYKLRIPMYSLS
jgi:hypothetical protein